MSIFSLGTIPVSQPLTAGTTIGALTGGVSAGGVSAGASASSVPGAFGAQLRSLRAGQSGTGSSPTQMAYQAQPKRGSPGNAHHPRGRYALGSDSNAADGTENGLSAGGAQRGGDGGGGGPSGTGGAARQAPGGVLLDSMMRGLQAYGATSSLA